MHYLKKPDICHLLLISKIASVKLLSSSELNTSPLIAILKLVLSCGKGGPKTGQTVPSSGNVPFTRYACRYFIVHVEGPDIDVCCHSIMIKIRKKAITHG